MSVVAAASVTVLLLGHAGGPALCTLVVEEAGAAAQGATVRGQGGPPLGWGEGRLWIHSGATPDAIHGWLGWLSMDGVWGSTVARPRRRATKPAGLPVG